MRPLLTLTVSTPLRVALHDEAVASLRAEDASGDFGILPGHADFLTVVDAGVLRWRGADTPWRFCALRGGVLTVREGHTVAVACREAILGDDLPSLRARVAQARARQLDEARQARSHEARLHARAIRQLMRQLTDVSDPLTRTMEDAA